MVNISCSLHLAYKICTKKKICSVWVEFSSWQFSRLIMCTVMVQCADLSKEITGLFIEYWRPSKVHLPSSWDKQGTLTCVLRTCFNLVISWKCGCFVVHFKTFQKILVIIRQSNKILLFKKKAVAAQFCRQFVLMCEGSYRGFVCLPFFSVLCQFFVYIHWIYTVHAAHTLQKSPSGGAHFLPMGVLLQWPNTRLNAMVTIVSWLIINEHYGALVSAVEVSQCSSESWPWFY